MQGDDPVAKVSRRHWDDMWLTDTLPTIGLADRLPWVSVRFRATFVTSW